MSESGIVEVDGTTDFVSKPFGSNDGDLIADALVGFEVESELWVVAFNDDLCGLLDGLSGVSTICSRAPEAFRSYIPLCERDP